MSLYKHTSCSAFIILREGLVVPTVQFKVTNTFFLATHVLVKDL